jgi:hypothetical protein
VDGVDLVDGVDGFEDEGTTTRIRTRVAHAFWRRIASRGLVAAAVSRS